MNLRILRGALLALSLAAFPLLATAQHRLVTGAAKSTMVQPDPSPRILRQRPVTLDVGAAAKAAGDARPYLEIAFFEDAVYRVRVERTEPTRSGGLAYHGRLLADPVSTVTIVDNGGAVTVLFAGDRRRFSIRGTPERGYVAREHVVADRPDHPPGVKPPTGEERRVPLPQSKADPAPPPTMEADDGATIDVMVIYTQAARTNAGSAAQIQADIDAQIALTNQVYANSNVIQRLRLVYRGEVEFTENANMNVDLGRLASTTDGALDQVPILRDVYKADLVSLWGSYGGSFCGIGYLMSIEQASFNTLGYNVVAQDCSGPGEFTFAHELGHNMGLRHDNFEDTTANTTVTPEGSSTPTVITYAHGHIDLVNRFRTVMSYNDQCAAQNPSFFCSRIPHFSNPAINFNNVANYPSAVSAPTGNATNAHERRALNDTRDTISNFRQPQLATFSGPGTLLFLPGSASVAEGGGSLLLKVGRHLGSTGAVSVAYATANGTASAGSDYAATSGTLNWAAGDTADQTITVPITQDTTLEGHETFTVTLSAPAGGATIAAGGGTATVRILDDEPDTFPVGTTLPDGFTSPNVPNANTPNSSWTVDTSQGYLSPMSLQSAQAFSPTGTFTEYGNSDLEYTANFAAGSVSFRYKLSSYHQNLAGFEFQVDGTPVFSNNAGGEVDWTQVTHALSAGQHTLRWRFKNRLPFPCDGATPPAPGGDNCASRAWIDALSLPATLPPPANPPRLGNISTRMQVLTGNDVMIGGFVIGGSANKTVVVRARGPSLIPFGITNALANPTLQLVRSSDQSTIATNNDWQSASNAAAITASGFAPSNNLESAILVSLPPGAYTAIVSGVGNGTGVGIVEVFEVDGPELPLANISTRGQVRTGNDVMIGGFVVTGTGPQTVVVRARGPSLIPFGITNALPNPTLQLVRASDQSTVATNDDWQSASNAAAITASGFAPSNNLESAILISLQPGAYTAIVSGVGGGQGVGIVEVFTTP